MSIHNDYYKRTVRYLKRRNANGYKVGHIRFDPAPDKYCYNYIIKRLNEDKKTYACIEKVDGKDFIAVYW